MTNGRLLALGVGTLLFALGVGIALSPTLAQTFSITSLVVAFGDDYLVAALVGGVAFLVAIAVLVRRSTQGFEQADPPTTEGVPTGTPLGEEIDRVIDGDLTPGDHLLGDVRTDVRRRLRTAAIETAMQTKGCSRANAAAMIAAGEWTDDDVAAAFLATEADQVRPTRRLLDALPGYSRFGRRTRRTVRAILVLDRTEGRT